MKGVARNTTTKNAREYRMGNYEWKIQRRWQYWTHKTQENDKQNKTKITTQHRKNKKIATRTPTKPES